MALAPDRLSRRLLALVDCPYARWALGEGLPVSAGTQSLRAYLEYWLIVCNGRRDRAFIRLGNNMRHPLMEPARRLVEIGGPAWA